MNNTDSVYYIRKVLEPKQLEDVGFKSFDAMHIACAESEKVDIFLTTDDKLLKLAKRNKNKLNIDIANPVLWLTERL